MKKGEFLITIIFASVFLFFNYTFSYMENSLYCEITNKSIRVQTKKLSENIKCNEYIKTLEYLILKEYKDIQTIDIYIEKKQDLNYWKELRESKKEKIKKMQQIRLNIIFNMKSFEENYLIKIQEYLQNRLSYYQNGLEYRVAPLLKLGTGFNFPPKIQREILLITSQLNTLKAIYTAPDIPTLLKHIKDYIYFKKQLEGN